MLILDFLRGRLLWRASARNMQSRDEGMSGRESGRIKSDHESEMGSTRGDEQEENLRTSPER